MPDLLVPGLWSPIEGSCFVVPAKPAGQPRARVGVIGGHARAFKSSVARRLEADVLAFAAPAAPPAPWQGPVEVFVEARCDVPLSWPKRKRQAALAGLVRPTGRPDADNIAKLILDALNRSGRYWRDDAQVVELRARKVYAAVPETVVVVRAARVLSRAPQEAGHAK